VKRVKISIEINDKSISGRIVPQWNGNQLEYSVCTRINSRGIAVPEDGLCPTPLQCEIRNDKHVCSCGKDKYLDKTYTLCCKLKFDQFIEKKTFILVRRFVFKSQYD